MSSPGPQWAPMTTPRPATVISPRWGQAAATPSPAVVAAALVGSMLAIKPVLYVPDRGTLDVAKKVRGRKAAVKAILDGALHDLSQVEDPTGLKVHILQADCRADAETVRDGLRAAFPQLGEITITGLGVVIGAHCGPGLLTVFYLCNGRTPE